MAANGGYRVFNTGDVLTAAQVQLYLQNQTVMYFATTTARDAVLTGATLVEGMVSYTPATGVMVYNGTAWKTLPQSPLTTKGDIWGFDTANNRIPVGTNGQVLTADSTNALGVSWQVAATGGMTLLSTTNLTGTSVTISSINQTYTNLLVQIQNPYLNAASAGLKINPNGTTGISPNTNANATTQNDLIFGSGALPAASTPTWNNYSLLINNYSNASYGKPFSAAYSSSSTSGSIFGGSIVTISAITSLVVTTTTGSNTFSGGQVLVYGVK